MQFSAPFRLKPGSDPQLIGYGGGGSMVTLAITNYGPDDLIISNGEKHADPVKSTLLPGSCVLFKMEKIWASCANGCSGTWTALTDEVAVKNG